MTTKKCIEFVTLVITKRGAWLPVGMMNFFFNVYTGLSIAHKDGRSGKKGRPQGDLILPFDRWGAWGYLGMANTIPLYGP